MFKQGTIRDKLDLIREQGLSEDILVTSNKGDTRHFEAYKVPVTYLACPQLLENTEIMLLEEIPLIMEGYMVNRYYTFSVMSKKTVKCENCRRGFTDHPITDECTEYSANSELKNHLVCRITQFPRLSHMINFMNYLRHLYSPFTTLLEEISGLSLLDIDVKPLIHSALEVIKCNRSEKSTLTTKIWLTREEFKEDQRRLFNEYVKEKTYTPYITEEEKLASKQVKKIYKGGFHFSSKISSSDFWPLVDHMRVFANKEFYFNLDTIKDVSEIYQKKWIIKTSIDIEDILEKYVNIIKDKHYIISRYDSRTLTMWIDGKAILFKNNLPEPMEIRSYPESELDFLKSIISNVNPALRTWITEENAWSTSTWYIHKHSNANYVYYSEDSMATTIHSIGGKSPNHMIWKFDI